MKTTGWRDNADWHSGTRPDEPPSPEQVEGGGGEEGEEADWLPAQPRPAFRLPWLPLVRVHWHAIA